MQANGKLIEAAAKLRKTSSTPVVVPGAAPALAKAGVGGFLQIVLLPGFAAVRGDIGPGTLLKISEVMFRPNFSDSCSHFQTPSFQL